MKQGLLVFVASVMNKKIEDLEFDRWVVKKALEDIRVTTPWLFEFGSASSQRVEDYYLNKVRQCDIFILILGKALTHPVRAEYQVALSAKKPCLVFVKRKEPSEQHKEVKDFLSDLELKYAQYTDWDELYSLVQRSVFEELVEKYNKEEGAKELVWTGKLQPASSEDGLLMESPPRSSFQAILLVGAGDIAKGIIESARTLIDRDVRFDAIDRYDSPPAKVSLAVDDRFSVVPMPWTDNSNKKELLRVIEEQKPDLIIPELFATPSNFYVELEQRGFKTIISGELIENLMNRRIFRERFDHFLKSNSRLKNEANDLKLRIPEWRLAGNPEKAFSFIQEIGYPCMIKPAITDLGLGQSQIENVEDFEEAWDKFRERARNKTEPAIIEKFIAHKYEVFQILAAVNGLPTVYPAIEYKRVAYDRIGGPWYLDQALCPITESSDLQERCQEAARLIYKCFLQEDGFFGIEFLVNEENEIYLNEITFRPDDMGFVTLLAWPRYKSQFDIFVNSTIRKHSCPQVESNKVIPSAFCSVIWHLPGPRAWIATNREAVENKYGVLIPLFQTSKALSRGHRIGWVLADATNTDDALEKAQTAVKDLKIRMIGRF